MNGGRNRGRMDCKAYTNGKGDRRVAVRISIHDANAIGAGDLELLDRIRIAITAVAESEAYDGS